MVRLTRMILCLLALTLAGCSTIWTRTVYVPDGKMVRLRQDVKNVKVWVKVSKDDIAQGRMDLHEGWFCKAPPKTEEE